ncbi:HET-domain-containing protein [Thozetella sp. PMI_491]|nr:HET-domain-containing protein [Thozetella sp. PMI_491]
MAQYKYYPLSNPSTDVRLIRILPGEYHEDIYIELSHVSLALPDAPRSTRISKAAIQDTLPDHWEVDETEDGRFLFECYSTQTTYWDHPSADFDHSLYAPLEPLIYEPAYEALSYTWGSPSPCKAIFARQSSAADSPKSFSTFKIGENLYHALKHLRYDDKKRTMWIDAICINQADDNERSQQVRRMSKIYELADRVVVWLGTEEKQSRLAMKTLEHLGKQLVTIEGHYLARSPESTKPFWFHQRAELPYTKAQWNSIAELLKRPWFNRLWVWQEIGLANPRSIVQCGSTHCLWRQFGPALACLDSKNTIPEVIWVIVSFYRALFRPTRAIALESLLTQARHFSCSDPRDRVYAILGLGEPLPMAQIVPNYGLSAAEVYKNTLLTHIEFSERLELLLHCDFQGRSGAASWVPDWSRLKEGVFPNSLQFSASYSSSKARYKAPNTLEVDGIQCGAIKSSDQLTGTGEDFTENALTIMGKAKVYLNGQNRGDAIAETAAMNTYAERFFDDPGHPSLFAFQRCLFIAPFNGGSMTELDRMFNSLFSAQTSAERELEVLQEKWDGLSLFGTENGYLGIGPPQTEPGDIVCVLLGCHMPIILRPQSAGSYRVVGAAYAHGLGDGEALLGPLPSPWTFRWKSERPDSRQEIPVFQIIESGEVTHDDPRLGDLPPGWEQVQISLESTERNACVFKNVDTGVIIKGDPRLLPEKLVDRGVKIVTFSLV